MDDPEPTRSSETWRSPYSPSPDWRETASIWMESSIYNQFNNFNYDYETFGELDNVTLWTEGVDNYVSYPFQLPDYPPHWVRQHDQYHNLQHSQRYAGQGGGGGEGSQDPPADSENKERRLIAEEAGQKLRKITELEKELNDAEMSHQDHAMKWGLPLRPGDKGNDLERSRQPVQLPLPPNQYHLLWRHDDWYSVLRPPPD
ncbi:uncharacterized protein ARMOST_10445 [Armillaria ostoyae]|uniref:Uncharacterized protein n=1 Tax=Armillaria ostoyae TaxID=47428 RepID=A0A284REA9_ARMOS|nr:uncharacterized protein ARMOST_10445 [Armillaria ostoyae]